MLLIARCGRRGRCRWPLLPFCPESGETKRYPGSADRTRVAPGFRFSVCRVEVGFAGGIPADLPSIALTDYNPYKVALLVSRSAGGLLISATPCSVCTYLISDRNYPIDRFDKIVGMPTLEIPFCIIFFDGLPTVKCSGMRRHINPILRVERGDGSRVLPVECLLILHSQRTNLLGYFWIDRVFLLGECRQSKADCQTYKGNY